MNNPAEDGLSSENEGRYAKIRIEENLNHLLPKMT